MINYFEEVKKPNEFIEIDIYEAMDMIKHPTEEIKRKVTDARNVYPNNKKLYDEIKLTLPCFTFNFTFNNYKKTKNINAPTGFLYLDVDKSTDLDLTNPCIFASWKSVSDNGRGILIIAEGLTPDNLKLNYKLLAEELNINADIKAAKSTQYCFHSHDEDLYINENPLIWICKNDLKNNPKHSYPYNSIKDSNEMGIKKESDLIILLIMIFKVNLTFILKMIKIMYQQSMFLKLLTKVVGTQFCMELLIK